LAQVREVQTISEGEGRRRNERGGENFLLVCKAVREGAQGVLDLRNKTQGITPKIEKDSLLD